VRPSRRQRLIALGKKSGQVVAEVGATRECLLRASVVKTEDLLSALRFGATEAPSSPALGAFLPR